MQTITAEQEALLTGDVLDIETIGCDLLNPDLSFREDISDDLLGGRVKRNNKASPHGTCSLQLLRELAWGRDLVRPYMTLTDGTISARWNLGVYLLSRPEYVADETPRTYDAAGEDRLRLLLRKVARDYTLAAGLTYRAALEQTFTAAGLTGFLIEGSAADSTLPLTRTWPLVAKSTDPDQTDEPVTWLRVINDLLRAINFRAVWCDGDGRFRCEAYRDPASRAPEFVFDADDPRVNILGPERRVHRNVNATPNVWTFIASNPPAGVTPTEVNGYVYVRRNEDDGDTSIGARGLEWPDVFEYEVASPAALAGLGDKRVAQDLRVSTLIKLSTSPFPPAGHFDVITYRDAETGGERKVQAASWDLPLDGSDMTWDMEVVS